MQNYSVFEEYYHEKRSVWFAINFRSLQAIQLLPLPLSSYISSLSPFSSLVGGLSTVVSLNLSHPDNPRMARQPRTKLNPQNQTVPWSSGQQPYCRTSTFLFLRSLRISLYYINPETIKVFQ